MGVKEQCRGALLASLELLQSQVEALHAAARRDSGPLGLLEVIRASEAVRISTLRALAEQYQRVAVDRLVPRELPIRQPPSRRPSALHKSIEAVGGDDSSPEMLGYGNRAEEMNGSDSGADDTGDAARGNGKEDEGTGGDKNHDEDVSVHLTASHNTAGSSKSPFQSEPPSPPQTPKIVPDDLQSTCTSELGPRPRASVFSVFCPEAMEYQVDLRKAMPSPSSASRPGKKQKTCCSRCGYRWDGTGNGGCAGRRDSTFMSSMSNNKPATATSIAIKHGFQLTPRFLGKSHCQSGGFGCVLCTSSGATGVYDTVESLRDHINTSHDKWQMLHERDLASR